MGIPDGAGRVRAGTEANLAPKEMPKMKLPGVLLQIARVRPVGTQSARLDPDGYLAIGGAVAAILQPLTATNGRLPQFEGQKASSWRQLVSTRTPIVFYWGKTS